MAKRMDGRKTTMRNLVLAGGLALGYLAIVVIGNRIVAAQNRRPGDTPVVLIGGSLRFKAGSTIANDAWQQKVLNQDYWYPAYRLAVIALKQKTASIGDDPDVDDVDTTTDTTRIPISNSNWRADLFTVASGNKPVAHLAGTRANLQIHIILDDTKGNLCPVGKPIIKKVTYVPSRDCNDDSLKFSKINVTVNGVATTPASLNCPATPTGDHHCKIVFRAH
jgi:hypothetical protein